MYQTRPNTRPASCYRLLVHCAGPLAVRFHKRHLATFLGNPEFKLFIQQLAEVGSAEELEQSQAVQSYRYSSLYLY